MRQITIGNITETVVERADFPPEKIKQILANETVAILGYGVQGRGQSLNMKDNGVRVIVGLRGKGTYGAAKPSPAAKDRPRASMRGSVRASLGELRHMKDRS